MATPDPPPEEFLASPPPGTHLIFWGDRSPLSRAAVASFLKGALDRNDLVVIVLPEEELDDFADEMAAEGVRLDELEDADRVVRLAAEEAVLKAASSTTGLRESMKQALALAKSMGRAGLTVIGRVAPVLFENGDSLSAAAVEEAANETPPDVRVLCLYNARSFSPERFGDVVALTRQHTHALTAVGEHRLFFEVVAKARA